MPRAIVSLNRRLVSTPAFEDCINTGRTAVEMPDYPLAPMQSSILACSTGPSMGITNLSMGQDNPELYDRGSPIIPSPQCLPLHVKPAVEGYSLSAEAVCQPRLLEVHIVYF